MNTRQKIDLVKDALRRGEPVMENETLGGYNVPNTNETITYDQGEQALVELSQETGNIGIILEV